MASKGMLHLNGNILCAVDIETTGFDPMRHDIWQICILPLDSQIQPLKDFMPFYLDIKPERPENADPDALTKAKLVDVTLRGVDSGMAADMLDTWFQKLELAFNKKICPLGANWVFDRTFIMLWLGFHNFESIFHPWYRDVLPASLYANDRAHFNVEQIPYPKSNLQYLCSCLKIERKKPHDAMDDCVSTAEVYRRMIKQLF